MSTFELNKIVGAILVALLIMTVIGIIGDNLVKPRGHGTEAAMGGNNKPAAETPSAPSGPAPIAPLLAKADPKKGEQDAKICATCHNFKEGQGKKIGPDLWNVVERPKASVKGFDYSSALKKKGGNWSYEDLNHWLWSPSSFAQGTKMTFAGIKDDQKRADVIAYLRTLSESPKPLPKPEAAKPAPKPAEAKPAQPAQKSENQKPPAAAGAGFAEMVAKANPKKGEQDARICAVCHNFKEGQGKKIGPDLWNVVDRPKASAKGFDFSSALKKKGGKWTYQDLDEWLKKPQAFAPGTKMTFAGISDEKKRADVVAYLRTLSESPAPLPKH
jgi:cytochrome c